MAASLISVPSSGGASASYTLAGNEAWQLVSVTGTLAIVNVINHVVPVVVAAAPSGETISTAIGGTEVITSTSYLVRWAFGGVQPGVASDRFNPGYLQAPLPLLDLTPGCTLTVRSEDTFGTLRVGDVWSAVCLWVDDD